MGKVTITQSDGVAYNAWKLWMRRRFAITRKSKHIGTHALSLHTQQLLFKGSNHFTTRGTGGTGTVFPIKPAFTIQAVESANFTIGRHQVYAKRNPKAATMNGAEYGRRKKNGHTHCILLWV